MHRRLGGLALITLRRSDQMTRSGAARPRSAGCSILLMTSSDVEWAPRPIVLPGIARVQVVGRFLVLIACDPAWTLSLATWWIHRTARTARTPWNEFV